VSNLIVMTFNGIKNFKIYLHNDDPMNDKKVTEHKKVMSLKLKIFAEPLTEHKNVTYIFKLH
jgi:hypothetical protein